MAKDQSLFSNLNVNCRVKVKLGNRSVVKAHGKGLIPIQTKQGIMLITDVLLIPDLDQNLLNVSQMENKGYSILFKDNHSYFYDAANIEIAKVKKVKSSYVLRLNCANQYALIVRNDDT